MEGGFTGGKGACQCAAYVCAQGEYQESRVSIDVFSSFALIALALACIGLAASMNASVAETSREIGIRSALGAKPHKHCV